MRVPVYPRGSNPRVDRPILRKSIHYAEEQVVNFLASWIDPLDPAKGIVALDFLPSGKAIDAAPEQIDRLTSSLSPAEVGGCKFCPPNTPKNPTIPRIHLESLQLAAINWDWSKEASLA